MSIEFFPPPLSSRPLRRRTWVVWNMVGKGPKSTGKTLQPSLKFSTHPSNKWFRLPVVFRLDGSHSLFLWVKSHRFNMFNHHHSWWNDQSCWCNPPFLGWSHPLSSSLNSRAPAVVLSAGTPSWRSTSSSWVNRSFWRAFERVAPLKTLWHGVSQTPLLRGLPLGVPLDLRDIFIWRSL